MVGTLTCVNRNSHRHTNLRAAKSNERPGGLRDWIGMKLMTVKLDRLAPGHRGDCEPVGGEVTERRVHIGPGYRVHCRQRGPVVIVMPAGGDKRAPTSATSRAQAMVKRTQQRDLHPWA